MPVCWVPTKCFLIISREVRARAIPLYIWRN